MKELSTGKSFSSDAASGWAGWALAHPGFGSSVNPITASPPGFENPAASLLVELRLDLDAKAQIEIFNGI